jgi:16S rRNA (cytosine967-C5)-methyltransferase
MSELIAWLQRRPPLWLRIQHADARAVLKELAEVDPLIKPHLAIPNAASMGPTRASLYNAPVYKEGRVEIQDLSSQAVGAVCAPRPGQRWWDCCAGGGGKSLLLASLMGGKGVVVASDIRTYKLQELKHRARRGNFSNITTRDWNGGSVPSDKATFDGVLVDAPCTGSGTWRRNPWARWTLRERDIDELAASQAKLLSNASTAVRPGGVLVYATCSMFKRENGTVVQAFLDSHTNFRLEPFRHPLLANEQTGGMVQTWPWDGDCDAMFVARMRRS